MLYGERHRIESLRLKGYDYTAPGAYFVTICAASRIERFGKVEDGNMRRNRIGEVAHQTWMGIPNHHQNVTLDEFVVMPNHVHGIIVLGVSRGDVARNVTYHSTEVSLQANLMPLAEKNIVSWILWFSTRRRGDRGAPRSMLFFPLRFSASSAPLR